MSEKKKGDWKSKIPALPADAVLLSLHEVAGHLRRSPNAVRVMIHGRADGSDGALGEFLRSILVELSPRRRYVLREPFMEWLKKLADRRSA